ncbi:CDP-diacylglycerol--serine O-phosphatidyltransferase [Nitrospira sp.]|nr:CDP-diacylglycerol--serine O-phosphatidyltransferase [Nitrospira sp.]
MAMRGVLSKTERRKAVYLIPNTLTTGNLFCGLYAVLSVYESNHLHAAYAVLVALIFDMLDGKSARWVKGTSQFGLEYDSLADVVSFGVAPGFLIYAWALQGQGMLGAAVMFAFVACGALRLARFNVISTASESRYFMGLPIPAAASVVATMVVFDAHIANLGQEMKPVVILIMTLVLAFLMVSTLKYRSFKDLKFKGWRGFNYLVWIVLALMLVAAWPQVMLFVVCAGYALSAVVVRLAKLAAGPFAKPAGKVPPTLVDSKP